MQISSVLLWLAGFCTLLYVVKLLLLCVGGQMAGGDEGLEGGEDAGEGLDPGFKLLTLQSLTAFGMGLGWMALALMAQPGMPAAGALGLGALNGLLLMLLSAWLMRSLRRLNVSSPLWRPTVHDRGRAHTAIPGQAGGVGLVQLVDARTQQARQVHGFHGGEASLAVDTEVEIVEVCSDRVRVQPVGLGSTARRL